MKQQTRRTFLSWTLMTILARIAAVVDAHDTRFFSVDELNRDLGVWGFPDCIQTAALTHDPSAVEPETMGSSLRCFQRGRGEKTVKIGCIGDSITAGVHSSGGNHTYPAQLQILLGSDDFSVTNLGACGSTMMKSANSPYWKRPQYETLTSSEWDILIIMLGTNDAKDLGSNGPANWPHNCSGSSAHDCPFSADYGAMIELARTLGRDGNAPDIFIAIPPPLMQLDAYGMNQTVINNVFPDLIPIIAEDNDIEYPPIDIFTALGGRLQDQFPPNGCTLDTLRAAKCPLFCDAQSCDQCHPDDDGYHVIAQIVMKAIFATGRYGA